MGCPSERAQHVLESPGELAVALLTPVSLIVVAVVVTSVISFSASITEDQLQYILATKDSDESKSERLRELVEKGINAEENDE